MPIPQPIDNVWTEAMRLWSMRVAMFWTAMGTVAVLWVGLAGSIPAPIFFGVGFAVIFSFGVARLLKQPGTEQ
jgi:hypothetical protein